MTLSEGPSSDQPRDHSIEPVTRSAQVPSDDTIALLRDLFPESISENKVDVEKLRLLLNADIDVAPERYLFTWAGKREAIRILQIPSRATLIPVASESRDFEDSDNTIVEGDSLEVLKLLYKSYFGRVKVIYIDPPYNTGKDRLYRDDFSDPLDGYLVLTGQRQNGEAMVSNPETGGRYHSAWLTMMYPRLYLARQMLTQDGVLFVSIDDHEVYHVRLLLNELFGEENFIGQITVQTNPKGRGLRGHLALSHDYILVYARSAADADLSVEKSEEEIMSEFPESDEIGRFRWLELRNTHRQFNRRTRKNLWFPLYVDPMHGKVSLEKSTRHSAEVYPRWPEDGFEGCWTWGERKVQKEPDSLIARQIKGRWVIFRKSRPKPKKLRTIWIDKEFYTQTGQAEFDALIPGRIFESPKPVALIKQCIDLATEGEDEIIMDFFAGSGTTAQAVLELNREDGGNRHFLLMQLPEPMEKPARAGRIVLRSIADICIERVRRVTKRMRKPHQGHVASAGPEDLGFRLFKMTRSNYKLWTGVEENDPPSYGKAIELFVDQLVDNWEQQNVTWEVLVKEGYGLNTRIEALPDLRGTKVLVASDPNLGQKLKLCLDKKLTLTALKPLALSREDVFICLDGALDDTSAANLALQCQLKTI